MDAPVIDLLQLYPRDMNIYGDWGNVLVLRKRLQLRGYDVRLHEYNPGDEFPGQVDLIVGGGGQDSGQNKIQADLHALGGRLKELADDGVPMLAICGLYQLFGNFFKTHTGDVIKGIGLLNVDTVGGPTRMIGNTVLDSSEFGTVIGYENHSGQTFLKEGVQPFGTVTKGEGNNGQDGTEGARYRNVVASYLHGSLLPKNPAVADFLVRHAALRRHGSFNDVRLDVPYEAEARESSAARPR
ncbi:glutamine amidotransferase [Arthrobacter crystallopoietes BAB-32]|uniref:Lipid II isoglutaminyl synthase (glutamine-hydrolyzing) subunit GatD n=1 Tax=Arthrobacter crystallopoietes BAB-32 TaxID=1246476 RepID=N1V6M4_9MICC|nr:glutamine amidotransferase [Arthrobacter crystallopoietes]EMY35747.1 glutamine amidotransferase [Arthrobacter crystallopoietes BAB-32]